VTELEIRAGDVYLIRDREWVIVPGPISTWPFGQVQVKIGDQAFALRLDGHVSHAARSREGQLLPGARLVPAESLHGLAALADALLPLAPDDTVVIRRDD
jgi:hypothetical protein